MDDAVEVAVVDRLEDLLDTVRRICLTVEFARHDIFKQLPTSDAAGRTRPSGCNRTE